MNVLNGIKGVSLIAVGLAVEIDALDIDEKGLDEMDRKLLSTIIEKFGGGPAGIETLSAAIREERDTLEDVYEPYLLQEGLIERTPRLGRTATKYAYRHLGLTAPNGLF